MKTRFPCLLAAFLALPLSGQSTARPMDPRPGAAGIGDPYFPGSGNGGYDVLRYDIELELEMPAGAIVATTRVTARAMQDLSRLNLDLSGLEVTAVAVDGAPAEFTREGLELIVTPPRPLAAETRFTVRVDYRGVPELAPDPSVAAFAPGVGWWRRDRALYVMSECIGAPSWFPCNDHPRDRARFTVTVTLEEPWVAASNGLLVEERSEEGKRTWVWASRDTMATYLATLVVGRFEERLEEGPRGMPLRLYYPPGAGEDDLAAFARTGEMIEYFESLFGPYPFECFGGVLAGENLAGALECQTLPIYSEGAHEGVVAHELAHQWFGNHVTVEGWRDLWLNEGFASYAEWLWRDHVEGGDYLEKRARRTYAMLRRRKIGSPFDPGVERLFSARVYVRGAFVIHALRRELGDEAFFELLRRWLERFGGASAGTRAFCDLAGEVAGRDLSPFFERLLYAESLPELEEFAEDGRAGVGR